MKLCILGATGQTGVHVVKQALEAGHEVLALVRNPNKMKEAMKDDISNEKLEVVEESDIFNEDALFPHIDKCDAVISTLGFPTTKPVVGYTNVTKAIVGAMNRSEKCKRVMLMHSWYTDSKSRSNASFMIRTFIYMIIGVVLDNMRAAELFLENDESAKNINYTCVYPAHLLDGSVTDTELKFAVNECFVKDAPAKINRSDVARFMLANLENEEFYRKNVAIAI